MEPITRNEYIEWYFTWTDNFFIDFKSRYLAEIFKEDPKIYFPDVIGVNHPTILRNKVSKKSIVYTIHIEYMNDLKANGYRKLSS